MSRKKTKQDLIKPLFLTQEDSGLVRIVLRHKKILGKLDPKHRLINIPLMFKNCEFMGEVDLRNCEFK
jgi:hypothetical protein